MTKKIHMFQNLRRIICNENVNTRKCVEDGVSNKKDTIIADPHITKKDSAHICWQNDDPELRILRDTFGDLVTGKTLEIPLQEFLTLLPRSRRRSDAYRVLKKKLQRIGVTLNIISNKQKKK